MHDILSISEYGMPDYFIDMLAWPMNIGIGS